MPPRLARQPQASLDSRWFSHAFCFRTDWGSPTNGAGGANKQERENERQGNVSVADRRWNAIARSVSAAMRSKVTALFFGLAILGLPVGGTLAQTTSALPVEQGAEPSGTEVPIPHGTVQIGLSSSDGNSEFWLLVSDVVGSASPECAGFDCEALMRDPLFGLRLMAAYLLCPTRCWGPGARIDKCVDCIIERLSSDPEVGEDFSNCVEEIKRWIREWWRLE